MAPPVRPSAPAPSTKGGCVGDRCASGRDAWPLHHLLHEGVFCQLCSSCVLLYNPHAFCSVCLHLLSTSTAAAKAPPGDPAVAAPGPTKACSVCGVSVAHLSCVAVPSPSPAAAAGGAADRQQPPPPAPYVCPPCAATAAGRDFSFAPASGRRPLELRGARVLLVAARLAHDSVSRAATAAREEAERRVAEAAAARKRSREMLDAAFRALDAEARDAKLRAAAAQAQALPQPKPQPHKKKPDPDQPPLPKKKPEPNRDRDKLLKLNAMQQPALAFAAAAAAAAATSVSSREEKKPIVVKQEPGSVPLPPPREDQDRDRPPLFGTLQS